MTTAVACHSLQQVLAVILWVGVGVEAQEVQGVVWEVVLSEEERWGASACVVAAMVVENVAIVAPGTTGIRIGVV